MAKKSVKLRKAERHEVERKVDTFARVLQIVALVAAAILLIVDAALKDYELPVWAVPSILGIAAGLSPEQIKNIIVEAIKAFLGKKK